MGVGRQKAVWGSESFLHFPPGPSSLVELQGGEESLLHAPPLLQAYNFFLSLFSESENELGMGKERGGQRIRSRLCADSREPNVGLKL